MSPQRLPQHRRERPITKTQRNKLERLGLPFREPMTQGEADDLIGTTHAPNQEELEILRFFKVESPGSHSETSAHQAITKIFQDQENIGKWEARAASKDQRDIYAFFKIAVPRGLTWMQAKATIDSIFLDEKNEEAWEAHEDHLMELEDAAEERKDWFEETLQFVNEGAAIYDYKKLGKQLFARVVQKLETAGMTLEQIADQDELIIKTAWELDPTRAKPFENTQAPIQATATPPPPKRKYARSVMIAILLFLLVATAMQYLK